MRNYLFSIVAHIIVLLLLILLVGVNTHEPLKVENAITIDFNEPTQNTVQNHKSSMPATAQNQKTSPPKVTQIDPERATFEKSLQTSQKPVETKKVMVQEESEVVKKVIPPLPPEPDPAEIERQQKAKAKAEKISKFKSLLSRSKAKADAKIDVDKNNDKTDGQTAVSNADDGVNESGEINGQLGGRRVIKTPVIKDDSQKKGRVVVKICVNAEGEVISSQYTQMGSTTSDNYLIKLAEEGARGYVFTASPVAKECGRIIIDFQLK